MAEVVQLSDHLQEVGAGYRIDPDKVLEGAKGRDFTNLLVLGQHQDGTLYIAGASNAGECIILMELAKHELIFGVE